MQASFSSAGKQLEFDRTVKRNTETARFVLQRVCRNANIAYHCVHRSKLRAYAFVESGAGNFARTRSLRGLRTAAAFSKIDIFCNAAF